MKKIISIFSVILILSTLLSTVCYAEPVITVGAESAILMEQSTGQIIYEKNMDKKQYPASITKVLTALITLEECEPSDEVTVSSNAVLSVSAGSSIGYLKAGEKLTVEQVLYAMLVASGNDAANVLAEHVSGSIDAFAEKMNARAKELGATNSHFVNANGLHDDNHYITAHDMAVITREAMTHDLFRKIVSTKSYTMPSTDVYKQTGDNERVYKNTNLLLFDEAVAPNTKSYYYANAIGVKTGYTSKAGNTLIAAASKDGMDLICVLLNVTTTENSNRYIDAANLFEYAFTNYKLVPFTATLPEHTIENGKQKLQLKISEDSKILTNTDLNLDKLTPKISLKQGLLAPIPADAEIGTVEYEINGEIYTFNLVAGNEVTVKATFLETIGAILLFILKLVLYIVLAIIALAIGVRVYKKITKKNKKGKARRYRN